MNKKFHVATGILFVMFNVTALFGAIGNTNPAGSYLMTVKAFSTSGTPSPTFTLKVTSQTLRAGPVQFTNAADVGPFRTPVSVAIGDFNNDGKQDFLTSNNGIGANTDQTRLTDNSADDSAPKWSPEDTKILFQSNRDGDDEIYTMNSDGTDQIQITFASSRDNFPDWSPDGTKPVYQDSGNLFTINADGSSPTSFATSGLLPAWGGNNTPTGTNITAVSGTTTVNFLAVGTSGTTTVVPIDPTTDGTVPSGYSLGAGYPAYKITTTATYTAPVTVCLKVPNATTLATFNTLRILHYVNGTPTNATILPPNSPAPDFATKTICARVNSFSPFVVAENLAPTAANVSVGGRVSTSNGSGISRVWVSVTNQNGETRSVTTNSFGFYHSDEIPAGQTYVISVFYKRYQFNSRVINVSEDIQNADFTAEPE